MWSLFLFCIDPLRLMSAVWVKAIATRSAKRYYLINQLEHERLALEGLRVALTDS